MELVNNRQLGQCFLPEDQGGLDGRGNISVCSYSISSILKERNKKKILWLKEKHEGIKIYMCMNNLMADCVLEEGLKFCAHFLVYALGVVLFERFWTLQRKGA